MNTIRCKRVMTGFQRIKVITRLKKLPKKTPLIVLFTICLLLLIIKRNLLDRIQQRIFSKSWTLRRYNGKNITTEFEHFYMNASPDKLMDPLIHKHQYNTLLNTGKECKEQNKFLLVLVYSATYKFYGRQIIRNTFGSISHFANRSIEYVFVLGQTNNNTLQGQIQKESVRYRDIIQGNFIDSYRNLTYKRVFSLFWVNKFCKNAIYVIKIDDDITINIPFLIPYLNNKINKNNANVLECFTVFGSRPYRETQSKWYTPVSDYRFPTFPPFCAGPSSIMSINVIRQMYTATSIVPFLWLEDVYGSGFIPWILNIEIVRPNCYLKDVQQSFNEKPCHLFYINNLKNTSDSYMMWKTIETHNKFKENCKCW
ncbi:beta-1,3-galactosyltransferase 5-like [Mytilus californianus]|uniref:beta-1,3-galactosyltransferase 5-like n=1 Tax=Mytilus californianus TaxID=6549 RepID=UPI0022459627|nr:beta-1,3-galactosyltransferase 5-like [Mytilus californianus]